MNWNVGSIIAIAVTVCGTIAAAADQPVRLNNLVVVHLDLESPQTGTFEFTFEDAGWVFVRTRDGRENAQVLLNGLKAPTDRLWCERIRDSRSDETNFGGPAQGDPDGWGCGAT